MELRCLQSPTVSSIPRSGLIENSFLRGRTIIKLHTNRKNCPFVRRTKLLDFRARTLVTTEIKSQAEDATPSGVGAKDGNLVFVAGATGKVGSRAVRELIKLGFNVRAGVRNTKRAESLVQSVQKIKLEDVAGCIKTIDKLELVECDLEKPDQIGPALGNSSIVLCCIGASEKEISDITGPYRIDYLATKNLIDAAISAKVDHFILLTSLGTNKVGFPAAILNLFWGVLIWKRKAEEALLASGLLYTIVRPGGMERPTDSYKETHNITLSKEDTLFGGQVSNLQVAELMAFMAKNRGLSYCKVVEVIAETSAPLTPMGELLKKIPSGREEIDPPKEPDGANDSVQVLSSIYAEREPEQTKPTIIATPLSPYIAYEDLKPPTSPTPTPNTGSGVPKDSKTEILAAPTSPTSSVIEDKTSDTSSIVIDNGAPKTEPLKQNPSSPYTNYEDLKPPTSPTPTTSTGFGATGARKIEITPTEATSTSSSTEANSLETPSITIEIVIPQTATKKQYPSSPYTNYEDLKPPSSPTPTPSGSKKKKPSELLTPVEVVEPQPPSPNVSEMSGNGKPDNPVNEESSGNINHHTESKARPLSPYTMYEEMKPPSSPLPLPRKV